jgi:hypothetical protein
MHRQTAITCIAASVRLKNSILNAIVENQSAKQNSLAVAPLWCKVVQSDAKVMFVMPSTAHIQENKSHHRLSVSLTAEQHHELNEIARKNRVSAAWVVREAIDRLLMDDAPLLHIGRE